MELSKGVEAIQEILKFTFSALTKILIAKKFCRIKDVKYSWQNVVTILDGNPRSFKGIVSSVLYYIISHMQYGITPLKMGTLDQLKTHQEKKHRVKTR